MGYSTILTIVASGEPGSQMAPEMHQFTLTGEVSSEREALREAFPDSEGLRTIEGDVGHGVAFDLGELGAADYVPVLRSINGAEVPAWTFERIEEASVLASRLRARGFSLQGFVSLG